MGFNESMQSPRNALKLGFYARTAEAVARDLLGATLRRTLDDGTVLTGTITETEAYTGPEDLASHSRGGRRTPRVESMWQKPGTAYVYFTYGMHYCLNVSCLREDHPASVLIRGIEPTGGIEIMRENRSRPLRKKPLSDAMLCNGPAKLCQAMKIDRALDGVDLLQSSQLTILQGVEIDDNEVERTARIGIGLGHDWVDKPLRWVRIVHPK